METLLKLVFVGLLVWAVWVGLQPRCAFVIRIAGGLPKVVKGVVTRAFLEQTRDVCSQHQVFRGTIRGVIRGDRISLIFSRDLPASAQQQLRNWWALSGWSARPQRARRRGPSHEET